MSPRTLTWGTSNWYVTFDNLPTLVALIPRKTEQIASNMALSYASRFKAEDGSVTLRKIHKRGTKT